MRATATQTMRTVCVLGALGAVASEAAKHDDGLPRTRWRRDGYLGGRHNFTTLCQDRYRDCVSWATEGECTGENGAHVRTVCPMSCSMCRHGMRDEVHCVDWARQGECSRNPDYMSRECPVACGFSQANCRDFSEACPRLAAAGECKRNPMSTLVLCGESCGVCRSSCHDLDDSCPNWILEKWHVDNPQTVLPRCSLSAGICHTMVVEESPEDVESDLAKEAALLEQLEGGADAFDFKRDEERMVDSHFPTCRDKNETLCKIWTRAACSHDPYSVIMECPRMCGACTTTCTDHLHSCHNWAERGLLTHHQWHVCPATAGVCTLIELHLRNMPPRPMVDPTFEYDANGAKEEL